MKIRRRKKRKLSKAALCRLAMALAAENIMLKRKLARWGRPKKAATAKRLAANPELGLMSVGWNAKCEVED